MKKNKLNKNILIEIGNVISNALTNVDVNNKPTLNIIVDNDYFTKIDEDLYYRSDNKEKQFSPSENEIMLNFNNVLIKIEKE